MVNLVDQNYIENQNLYNKIYEDLRKDLDESIPINHVGSTAIPDMVGKNIIDILIGAVDENQFEELIEGGIVDRKEYKNTKSEYVTKLIERAKLWNNGCSNA